MKSLLVPIIGLLFLSGCSATWEGVKQDSSEAWKWSKGQVNQGASYVKEKTE